MIPNADSREMRVTKRNGCYEDVSFDKILKRIKQVGKDNGISINFSFLCLKVIDQLYDTIPSEKIDELMAEQCASMVTSHPDYDKLASNIIISNHQKNTCGCFMETMKQLYNFTDNHNKQTPLISKDLWELAEKYADEIEEMIDYKRDFLIDYFGFKTLERAYLMRTNGCVIERPQHMWMRVALGIHGANIAAVKETYNLMSSLVFTHATPTLFNAGTPRPQLSSCYLLSMQDDSIDGIYDTLKECAQISKWAGGIGLHIHNIRATGSHIRGTNGNSNGLIPMLRVFNSTARYVDQGGGKRNGSFAVYLEPWHADIELFLEAKKNHGDEELKARDLFYALWIPDYFMECVQSGSDWHLLCPDMCPGLADCVGDDFITLYKKYVADGKFITKVSSRELWRKILDSQMETGTPYLLYKDSCNKKSNQQNLGVIKSSNLCTEIVEYSSPEETAVCNLASIALNKFVLDKTFDYDELHRVCKVVTRNLNRVIDINYYPNDKTMRSNVLHRPIGIGVQGMADAFALLDIPFHSDNAKVINKQIFETIYHAALETSNELAIEHSKHVNIIKLAVANGQVNPSVFSHHKVKLTEKFTSDEDIYMLAKETLEKNNIIYSEISNEEEYANGAYSSFKGSPASKGILQYDMWNVKPSDKYDWHELKGKITKYGIRNSLLVAPMPTASTSQILGNNECFEPFTSNIYSRRTLAGEFVIVNKHLMKDMLKLNLWSDNIKNNIIANKGSIQHLEGVPQHIKEKYKIVWEMPMKHLIDMASDRGAFICQSQSLNLWLEEPSYKTLTSMHFYSWKQGLKTGIYYLRRKAKHQPQQFTIAPEEAKESGEEVCEMCSG